VILKESWMMFFHAILLEKYVFKKNSKLKINFN